MIYNYIIKVLITSFVGFCPAFEIYVAVPSGIAVGLDWISAFLWASIGNWLVVPFVIFLHSKISNISFMKKLTEKSLSGKWHNRIEKGGSVIILLLTPFAGVWAISIIGKALQFNNRRLMILTAISIFTYGFVLALTIHLGIYVYRK